MTNNLILNFDIIKNVLAKAKNEENDKFFGICNKISHNVFDFLNIKVKVKNIYLKIHSFAKQKEFY